MRQMQLQNPSRKWSNATLELLKMTYMLLSPPCMMRFCLRGGLKKPWKPDVLISWNAYQIEQDMYGKIKKKKSYTAVMTTCFQNGWISQSSAPLHNVLVIILWTHLNNDKRQINFANLWSLALQVVKLGVSTQWRGQLTNNTHPKKYNTRVRADVTGQRHQAVETNVQASRNTSSPERNVQSVHRYNYREWLRATAQTLLTHNEMSDK